MEVKPSHLATHGLCALWENQPNHQQELCSLENVARIHIARCQGGRVTTPLAVCKTPRKDGLAYWRWALEVAGTQHDPPLHQQWEDSANLIEYCNSTWCLGNRPWWDVVIISTWRGYHHCCHLTRGNPRHSMQGSGCWTRSSVWSRLTQYKQTHAGLCWQWDQERPGTLEVLVVATPSMEKNTHPVDQLADN